MHGLDAHAARDTYPGLIVREVMEKVHRNVKSRLNAFISVLGAILQLCGRLKLINADKKKKWLVAISPYLVYMTDYCLAALRKICAAESNASSRHYL